MIAFANPLRSLAGDAAHLTELIKTIDGPIVLAGHSYGGAVITNVPAEAGDIVGLVFVAAFATNAGESPGEASSLVPGGTLAETIETVPLPDGGVDQYIAGLRPGSSTGAMGQSARHTVTKYQPTTGSA